MSVCVCCRDQQERLEVKRAKKESLDRNLKGQLITIIIVSV